MKKKRSKEHKTNWLIHPPSNAAIYCMQCTENTIFKIAPEKNGCCWLTLLWRRNQWLWLLITYAYNRNEKKINSNSIKWYEIESNDSFIRSFETLTNQWRFLHFIWLDVMMLRWLCCSVDVRMLLLLLFKLIGVDEASDDACVVVMLFAFDVFVCSWALDDVVVGTTTDDTDTVPSAPVVVLNIIFINLLHFLQWFSISIDLTDEKKNNSIFWPIFFSVCFEHISDKSWAETKVRSTTFQTLSVQTRFFFLKMFKMHSKKCFSSGNSKKMFLFVCQVYSFVFHKMKENDQTRARFYTFDWIMVLIKWQISIGLFGIVCTSEAALIENYITMEAMPSYRIVSYRVSTIPCICLKMCAPGKQSNVAYHLVDASFGCWSACVECCGGWWCAWLLFMDEFNADSDVPNTNGKYCCGSFCCSDFALPTILFLTAQCFLCIYLR